MVFASLSGPKVTMLKSSVKRNGFRMVFRTKSDRTGLLGAGGHGRDGAREVGKSITFYTTFGHGPILALLDQKVMRKPLRFTLLFDMVKFGHFWSEKPCEHHYVLHYFSTWAKMEKTDVEK